MFSSVLYMKLRHLIIGPPIYRASWQPPLFFRWRWWRKAHHPLREHIQGLIKRDRSVRWKSYLKYSQRKGRAKHLKNNWNVLGTLTNTRYSTNSINIIDASLSLNLQTGNKCFICGLHVCWKINAESNSWKRRSLAPEALGRELGVRNNSFRFLCSIDLRYNNTTWVNVSSEFKGLDLSIK